MPDTSVSQLARVAREPRRLAAFGDELLERGVERDDDVRRRRVAPLRRLLHVRPLVVQIERQRRASCPRDASSDVAAHDHEAHAGRAFDALAGGRDQRVERRSSRASIGSAPNELIASTISRLAVTRDDLRDRRRAD